jgi:pseudouridine synthase
VRPKDTVSVDGKRVLADADGIYIALFKPAGVITSLDDPEGRTVVTDLLPKDVGRVWPVGRLDWESEGLILMTNDGDLTNLLTHPSGGVEKTYHVKLRGVVRSKDPALDKMREGVTLDDGFQTSTADVSVDKSTGKHTWVQVVLHEGRNRQIRKMAEAVGHTVLRLRRVEIGPLSLTGLRPGDWRNLYRDEVMALYEAAGTKASAMAAKYSPDKPGQGGVGRTSKNAKKPGRSSTGSKPSSQTAAEVSRRPGQEGHTSRERPVAREKRPDARGDRSDGRGRKPVSDARGQRSDTRDKGTDTRTKRPDAGRQGAEGRKSKRPSAGRAPSRSKK